MSYRYSSYTYDRENQLTSLSSPAGDFNFEYDDLSRMTKMMYPNGMRAEMSFENDIRLSKVEHIKPGLLFDKVQSVFSYQYNNNNNKTRMKTFRKTLPVNETLNYTYDNDKCVQEHEPTKNFYFTYVYDCRHFAFEALFGCRSQYD